MLLDLIQQGKCTPFIGAGACAGILPTATELAQEWANKYEYPLPDTSDLARVAQFLAISRYAMFPKVRIQARFQGKGPPDFSQPNEPHALLADLNLPIYITTNYDDFMVQALGSRKREPVREFCRWNNFPGTSPGRPSRWSITCTATWMCRSPWCSPKGTISTFSSASRAARITSCRRRSSRRWPARRCCSSATA
jgi:hypothetical protein